MQEELEAKTATLVENEVDFFIGFILIICVIHFEFFGFHREIQTTKNLPVQHGRRLPHVHFRTNAVAGNGGIPGPPPPRDHSYLT